MSYSKNQENLNTTAASEVIISSTPLPLSGGIMTGNITTGAGVGLVAQNSSGTFGNIGGSLFAIRRFTSGTNATYTPSSTNVRMLYVELLGGGGGGGGAESISSFTYAAGASGGGGGYVSFLVKNIPALGVIRYTVAASAAGGSSAPGSGGAGNDTVFYYNSTTAIYTAEGGNGGAAGAAPTSFSQDAGGSAGGGVVVGTVPSGVVLVYSFSGGIGHDCGGMRVLSGNTNDIKTGSILIAGSGGVNAKYPSSNPEINTFVDTTNGSVTGRNAFFPGVGGGGSVVAGVAAASGGTGFGGEIIIWEFI